MVVSGLPQAALLPLGPDTRCLAANRAAPYECGDFELNSFHRVMATGAEGGLRPIMQGLNMFHIFKVKPS